MSNEKNKTNENLNAVSRTSTTYTTSVDSATKEVTLTFPYTGAAQTWNVPTGVTKIDVDAYGASGSSAFLSGKGGRVETIMSVTGGDVLKIYVGGSNTGVAASYPFDWNGEGFEALYGGWNGGGNGAGGYPVYLRQSGGAGGGGTDIRINGNALTDRVIVAGGGGGGGHHIPHAHHYGEGNNEGEPGGHGGGLVGENGSDLTTGLTNTGQTAYRYGKGGTQTAGGSSGYYYYAASDSERNDVPSWSQAGPGKGQNAATSHGGGGGGGYYGGGGGSGRRWEGDFPADIGGGGGGSSYTHPTLCAPIKATFDGAADQWPLFVNQTNADSVSSSVTQSSTEYQGYQLYKGSGYTGNFENTEFTTHTQGYQNADGNGQLIIKYTPSRNPLLDNATVTLDGPGSNNNILTARTNEGDLLDITVASYQWQLNGDDITGQTSTTLDCTSIIEDGLDDSVSYTFTCNVTFQDENDNEEEVSSNGISINPKLDDGTVTLSGPVDNVLTVTINPNTLEGITASYQWQRNGNDITGQTSNTLNYSSLSLSEPDTLTPYTFTCSVTFEDANGFYLEKTPDAISYSNDNLGFAFGVLSENSQNHKYVQSDGELGYTPLTLLSSVGSNFTVKVFFNSSIKF